MIMKNKKGSGNHLEIILSFVIFVGFLIFLFAILQISSPVKSKVGLNALETGIINFTKTRVDYFSLAVMKKTGGVYVKNNPLECFNFDVEFNLDYIIARDETGRMVEAKEVDGTIFIIDELKMPFFKIYSSPDFEENFRNYEEDEQWWVKCLEDKLEDPESYPELKSELGYMTGYEALSLEKIDELVGEYNRNYAGLQARFEIPTSENFGFSIMTLNGEEIAKTDKRVGRVVTAREVQVEIVNKSGDFTYAVLNMQTW